VSPEAIAAASATETAAAGTAPAEAPPADAAGAAPADAGATGTSATGAAATEAPPADAGAAAAPADASGAAAPPADAAAAPAAGGPLSSDRIQLVGESGRPVTVGVRTPVGKHVVRQFGDDSNVWDAEQFVLERGEGGAWQIVPAEGTTNETLVNGEPVTSPRPLHDGDVIAVGRAEKGIAKLPLTVRSA
jgi:hypothetical protein